MNPHQKNKIDVNALSADEQRLFRLYGKLPNKKDLLQNKLKERKYFDSGDYALSKAGKASDTGMDSIGTEHPKADDIPHLSPLTNQVTRGDSVSAGSPPTAGTPTSEGMPAGLHRGSINGIPGGGLPGHSAARSPVKESSYLARSASMDDNSQEGIKQGSGANTLTTSKDGSISPPPQKGGIPIRR